MQPGKLYFLQDGSEPGKDFFLEFVRYADNGDDVVMVNLEGEETIWDPGCVISEHTGTMPVQTAPVGFKLGDVLVFKGEYYEATEVDAKGRIYALRLLQDYKPNGTEYPW